MKVIVEIPKGSTYKYEISKTTGKLTLDRVLVLPYPANYGYIEGTLSEDGDPLDVFIAGSESIPPLTEVTIEILGVVEMLDGGKEDSKIIARIAGDDSQAPVRDIEDFLRFYKSGTQLNPYGSKERALEVIEITKANYLSHKPLYDPRLTTFIAYT